MQSIPAYPHASVDFAFVQAKESSLLEPVIAIQDHTTPLPSSPSPLVHSKMLGCFFNRLAHSPALGEQAPSKAVSSPRRGRSPGTV